jgi:uncharacterized spore protein YtfJ
MDEVDDLYEQSLGQLKELLDADKVVGEAIETPQATVIPLFSTGFGFGAGKGGKDGGSGGGAGAGGGIKPVSVIIVGDDGVRVHRLTEGDAIERLAEAAGRGVDRMADRFGGRRERSTAAPEAPEVEAETDAQTESDA